MRETIMELRSVFEKLPEDTLAEASSLGYDIKKDKDIEKLGSILSIFAAHEEGEKLSDEELSLVSGGGFFKKLWHDTKDVWSHVAKGSAKVYHILRNRFPSMSVQEMVNSDVGGEEAGED
ncbi:MAG: hypothetical protein ACLFQJ_09785 [Campylobacterales bacterium]